MIEAVSPYLKGRLGAWVGLLLYVTMDIALKLSVWLDAAPDDLGSVREKQWLSLTCLIVAGAIKTARSFVSESWSKSNSDSRNVATKTESEKDTQSQ